MYFIVNNIGKIAIVLLLSTLIYFNSSINYLKSQNEAIVSEINTLSIKNNEIKGMIIKVDTSRTTNELTLTKDLTVVHAELVEMQNKLTLHKNALQKQVLYNKRLSYKINACMKRCKK